MGAFQLPDSVTGAAIGCLSYSGLCLVANVILVWLIWVHRERTSYVAFIAYFTLLATVSSLVQQLYDYILWMDIMTWQFWYGRGNSHDAEVQYQNEIFGLKLALSYIRISCFMVEASLVFFFSLALAATVYGWWAKKPQALRNLSIIGRVIPPFLAVVSIVLLQFDFTHQSFFLYMIIANAQFVLSLLGACIFLGMILFKYLQTRRRLNTWLTLDYGNNGKPTSTLTASTGKKSTKTRRSRAYSGTQSSATFDNWLVIRLSIAFLTLCVFEWTNISPRLRNREKVLASLDEIGPDLSHKRAMSTVTGYLSGVSPSLLAFLVFGTTKAFQRKMYCTFIPKLLRREEDDNLTSIHHLPFSTGNSSYARASTLNTSYTRASTANSLALKGGVANHHANHHSLSSLRTPEAVFAPGMGLTKTPGSPRTPGSGIRHQQSEPSLRGRPEHIIPSTLPPTRGNSTLKPIHEPGHDWLDDPTPPESLHRSQIGVAVSEPSSPALNVVAPWHEPFPSPGVISAAVAVKLTPSIRRGPTFLRDSDDDSSSIHSSRRSDARSPAPPPLSLPISRFAPIKDKPASSHGRHERSGSTTGSVTQIWSEGRPEREEASPRTSGSTRRQASHRWRERSESATRLGQGTKTGRDYSRYVAPVRRGSNVQ